MTTTTLTLGEQLDAIGRRLDETGAAWAAAGYPDSGPQVDAREATCAHERLYPDGRCKDCGVTAGREVVIDTCHMNNAARTDVYRRAASLGKVPVEVCNHATPLAGETTAKDRS